MFVVLIGTEVLTIALAVSIVKAQKDMAAGFGGDDVASGAGSSSETPKEVVNGSAVSDKTTNSSEEADSAQLTFGGRCDRVARQYNLSKREVDVLRLLARGYSSARIQSELYIAPGTVNYHTRNIYSKLGIHSKQALIDLVRNS